MSIDKRMAPRQDLRWEGVVVDSAEKVVSQCMTVNISATGAKLIVQSPQDVPQKFDLVLSKNGGVRRHCKVMWTSGNEMGVQFITPPVKPQSLSQQIEVLTRLVSDIPEEPEKT